MKNTLLACLWLGLNALADTPKSLGPTDWAQIRAEYDRHRRAALPVKDGEHVARNLDQQWLTRFNGRHFEVVPDKADWHWGLELQSYGFPGELRTVGTAKAIADIEKFQYQWDSTISEWFINGSSGLEHGFTLQARPGQRVFGARLKLHLGIVGTLRPRISSDGRDIAFHDAQGAARVNYRGLRVMDAAGRQLAASFTRSADGLVLAIDEQAAVYPVTIDPVAAAATQQVYLKPGAVATTQNSHNFGAAVAVSGDTVVVGAPRENSSSLGINGSPNDLSSTSGAAYVFVRTAGGWSQQAYLKPAAVGSTQDGDQFGGSVAVSGDTVVVGAYKEASSTMGVNSSADELAPGAGAAYVFVRTAGVWSQQAYLKPTLATPPFEDQTGNQFGVSVALSGDTLVVGSNQEYSITPPATVEADAGAAYVFVRSRGVWSQQARLSPVAVGTTQAGDYFGLSVAVSGDTVVVGAPFEASSTLGVNSTPNELAGSAGAAYVFVRNTSGPVPLWFQQAYLKPGAVGTTQAGDGFGRSVGVSGDTVVVGANGEDSSTLGINSTPNESASAAGAAYVFVRNTSGPVPLWSQQAYLKPAAVGTTERTDIFGLSVAISGDTVVVGAPGEDSSTLGVNTTPNELASSAGAAYVFVRSAGAWSQRAYLKPAAVGTAQAGDFFGDAVAVSGDTVLVGANFESSSTLGVNGTPDDLGFNAGAAYVFVLPPSVVNVTVNSSPSGRIFSSTGAGCEPGLAYTTSSALTWTPGSSCLLNFSSLQAGTLGTQYVFTQWEDASTNASRSLTAPSAAAVYTASFKTQYSLTTVAGSGGMVSPASGTFYDAGTSVTVTASPLATFSGWSGACTGTGTCTLSMDGPKSVTASFAPPVLTVTAAPAGLGTVNYGNQSCATTCTSTYANGALVTLTAVPLAGNTFTGWSGGCTGAGTCAVTMDAAKTVTGSFAPAGATTLSAALGVKSGPSNARVWPVIFTNSGPGNASSMAITGFSLTQTLGPACAPVVVTPIPVVNAGSITGTGSATSLVTINFAGCAATARFRLTMPYTANAGVNTGTAVINNQLQ